MSPRAACRLEALGFKQVYDYVGGKADWLANGLPREGTTTAVVYAGEVVDPDPPTCQLDTPNSKVAALLAGSKYGFCLVVSPARVVLGRVRRSALDSGRADATAETLMEAGPSTVRFNMPAADLSERLADRRLKTAIVTTPTGCLVGVFHRDE
jgi:hypothetical protein